MGERKWTPEQTAAIGCRGGTVLVSAAAGSGKTAVLVQRVIDILTDEEKPVSPAQVLVVTFSNAAAAQMRQRIGARFSELVAEHPENQYLQRQQMLLSSAHISTVHAFCLDLIKSNFQRLNIAPDCRLGNDKEIALLEDQVAQEVIEQCYERDEGQFAQLVELISSGRDDNAVVETLHTMYQFIRSHPFYQNWLIEKSLFYEAEVPVAQSIWGVVILDYAKSAVEYAVSMVKKALEELSGDEQMEKAYQPALESDLAQYVAVKNAIETGTWDDICCVLSQVKPQRLGTLRNYGDDGKKELVKSCRETAKNIIKKLAERQFCATEQEFLEDIAFLRPKIETLFQLVRDYDNALMEEKRRRHLMDFADLEHFAVELLAQRQNGGFQKTEIAEQLTRQFQHVLVDEYQDTNETQDTIFHCVSREDNLFMVGDVKQSIYRFRQAMPEIFLEKQHTFQDYDGQHYPSKIILSNNFRSRSQVTQSINYIFSMLMSREVGEMDYTQRESLVASAAFPPKEDAVTEVHILENQDSAVDDTFAEAIHIARQIQTMLESGYTVTGEDNILRPVEPKDICILLRSPKNKAEVYIEALSEQGISVWTDIRGGYMESVEIVTVLSLLRAVNNPLIDIHLTAAMMSAVFQFSADEMAQVRMYDRKQHLYLNCLAMAEEGDEKCRRLTQTIQRLRMVGSASPSYQLIQNIIESTGIWAVASAMSYGAARQANLQLLVQYAKEYDACGYKGLSGFLRFLDNLEERGEELEGAPAFASENNAVRVMSIHRSKGLEFPIVFLADTSKKFNLKDLSAKFLLHSYMGFACVSRDLSTRKEFTTVPLEAVRLELERSTLSEEMRILYVALTRAKEKLIITMSPKNIEKKLASFNHSLGEDKRVSPYIVREGRSYADWLLMALLYHVDAIPLCADCGARAEENVTQPESRFIFRLFRGWEEEPKAALKEKAFVSAEDPLLVNQIQSQVQWQYQNIAATRLPSKLTVSQIVQLETEGEKPLSKEPNFLKKEGMTGAQKGTAMHNFLSYACHEKGEKDLEQEISRLVSQSFLTAEEAKSLDRTAIQAYYQSPLYRRIKRAPWVKREFAFMVEMGKKELEQVIPQIGENKIAVQGIADLIFEEEGQLVLVDFKTDRTYDPKELASRYGEQLKLYAVIAQTLLEKPVKEKIIYSLYQKGEIIL